MMGWALAEAGGTDHPPQTSPASRCLTAFAPASVRLEISHHMFSTKHNNLS